MNAIISLCHFCEVHGPAVLFCTQAFHSDQPINSDDEDDQDDVESSGDGGCSSGPSSWLSFQPSDTAVSGSETDTDGHSSNGVKQKKVELCEACRSLPNGQPGYVSNDVETRVSYVSSQYPQHPEVFSIVRQACLRSLSCEVCPGREGPIFFGDDHGSQVLGHMFVVNDSTARGLQRLYSIVVVMMDKVFLLNSWPFLVSHLRHVIDQIKAKVDKEECARCPTSRDRHAPLSTTARHGRMSRCASKTSRSLFDLTGDAQIFVKLHQAFAHILRAGGSRLTERLLEGPPTEDSVIDYDRQEDTEEGFVKLFSHVGIAPCAAVGGSYSDDEDQESALKATHIFTSLRNLLKVLNFSRFHVLAHHVVVGNQLIVRAAQRQLVRSVIDCLKTLLPKGCCHAVYFTKKYEDWQLCNFVGMSLHSPVPDQLVRDGVILEISDPRLDRLDPSVGGAGAGPGMTQSMCEQSMAHQIVELSSRHYHIYSPRVTKLPNTAPTVLSKMEKALLNEQLADSVAEQSLVCLKEEWMSKVKVMYKFTKIGGNRSKEDTQKLLQIVGAKEEDKRVLEFWMKGLSDQYRSNSDALEQT